MESQPAISEKLNDYIHPFLKDDEEILWVCEHTSSDAQNKISVWFSLIFSAVVVGGLAFMVQIWSLLQGAQGIYVILILAIAFAVVFGAPVYAVMNRDAFSYAITNRRIFVLNSVPFITHAVIEPHEIQHVSVSERKGKGTVYLFYYSLFASTFTHVQRQLLPTNKLSNIRDPHRAASLIREYLLPIKSAEEKRNAEEEAKKPVLNQGLFKPTKW